MWGSMLPVILIIPSLFQWRYVTISHGSMLITHTQSPACSWLSGIYHFSAPIEIGNGAWLGANSIVLPGVIIASDTMIGAGSVVATSTGSRELWAGNPCRKVKSLDLGKDKGDE